MRRLVPLRDEEPSKKELEAKLLARGILYSGSAAVVYLAVYPILSGLFGVDLLALGIYLPMLVVEPLLIYRFGRVQESPRKALSKGMRITVGYSLLLLLLGCVREWLSAGTVFGHLLSRPILRIVFGRIDDDVMRFSQTYFLISAISYPFIGFYNAGAALFRAQGNSRISMLASLVMNIINICFNALFIYGLGMGVLGAALATLLGRVFAAAWVFWQQQQIENPLCIRHIADMKPDGDLIRRILGIGIPSGLENGMFQIGKLCVSSLTSTLGTSAIAANAVANTISGIANIPGSTMGLAMIPVVSRCLGAGDKKQAKHYAKMFILMAMLGLFCTNACLFFTIPYIARLFSLSDTALNMCVTVMHWFSLFSVVCWATSFTLPNALRSGGDARYTMTVSIFSMWLFRVILSYIFVLKLNMGLTGVWFGMFIDWICRSVFFMIRFVSNKWMDHNVI